MADAVASYLAGVIRSFCADVPDRDGIVRVLQSEQPAAALRSFTSSRNDANRVLFISMIKGGANALADMKIYGIQCTVGAPGPDPPQLAVVRHVDELDLTNPLAFQLMPVQLAVSSHTATNPLPLMTVLESCLRHAYSPALRAELSRVSPSGTSSGGSHPGAVAPAVAARLVDTEARLAELVSLVGSVRASASCAVPRITLSGEVEVEAAAVVCAGRAGGGKALSPGECGLSADSDSTLLLRLESRLSRWITAIRSLASLLAERDEEDVEGARAAGEEEGEGGWGGRARARTLGSGSSALSDPCPGGPWALPAMLPWVRPPGEEMTWWASAREGVEGVTAQIREGHVVRLTLALLRDSKKRFAVSALESEAEALPALLARVTAVTTAHNAFPLAALHSAADTPSLARALHACCDHIRRALTGGAGAVDVDVLRCQRLLWGTGDEAACGAVRILRLLCRAAAGEEGEGAGPSPSLLHLPLPACASVAGAWEGVEGAWRDGCEAVRLTVEALDRKDKGAKGGAQQRHRMKLNPLLLRLGERVRVACEWRRGHATFIGLLEATLGEARAMSPTHPHPTLPTLCSSLSRVRNDLDRAWAAATGSAADPLDIADARGVGVHGGQAAGWVTAIIAHETAVRELEGQAADAFARAFDMCIGVEGGGGGPLSEAALVQCCALFNLSRPWLSPSSPSCNVERVAAALAPAQRICVGGQGVEGRLRAILQDRERVAGQGGDDVVARVRALLALRRLYEGEMDRVRTIALVGEGEGGAANTSHDLWRSSSLCRRLVPLADECDEKVNPGLVLLEWTQDVTRRCSGGAVLDLHTPLLALRACTLRPEELHKEDGVLHCPDELSSPSSTPALAVHVTLPPALHDLARTIRGVGCLVAEAGEDLPPSAALPLALRSVALSEEGARPLALSLRAALSAVSSEEGGVRQAGDMIGDILKRGQEGGEGCDAEGRAVAEAMLSSVRSALQSALSIAASPTCTWLSDGAERAVQRVEEAAQAYCTVAKRLAGDVSQLRSSVEALCSASSLGVEAAVLAPLLGGVGRALAGCEGAGSSHAHTRLAYTSEGLAALESCTSLACLRAVQDSASSSLSAWSTALPPECRVTSRLSIRSGAGGARVEAEPRAESVCGDLFALLRARVDGYASLHIPDLSSGGWSVGTMLVRGTTPSPTPSPVSLAIGACIASIHSTVSAVCAVVQARKEALEHIWRLDWAREANGLGSGAGDMPAWVARLSTLVSARSALENERLEGEGEGSNGSIGLSVLVGNGRVRVECGELLARAHAKLDAQCSEGVRLLGGLLSGHAAALTAVLVRAVTVLQGRGMRGWAGGGMEGASAMLALYECCVQAYGSLSCAGAALLSSTPPQGAADGGWSGTVHAMLAVEAAMSSMSKDGMPPGWLPLSSPSSLTGAWTALSSALQGMVREVHAGMGSGKVGQALEALEGCVRAAVASIGEEWAQCRPTSPFTPPCTALALCASYATRVAALEDEATLSARARVSMAQLAETMGMGRVVVSALAPSTVHPFLSALSRVSADIACVESVAREVEGVWEALEGVRTLPWTAVQAATVRVVLDGAAARLASMTPSTLESEVHVHLTSSVRAWRAVLGVVADMRAAPIQERHLASMGSLLGMGAGEPPISSCTLGSVLGRDIGGQEKFIREVCRTAAGEAGIASFLGEISSVWAAVVWDTALHKSGRTRVVRGWDALLSLVDDHSASLSAASSSPFAGHFAREVSAWTTRLLDLRLLLDCWVDVQRTWLYLDGLLSNSPDIKVQLPAENARFLGVDAELAGVVALLASAPAVLAAPCLCAGKPVPHACRAGASPSTLLAHPLGTLTPRLKALGESLARVQAGLAEYLEARRAAFPRFFFLGDEDLLEMLGSAKDPSAVSRHLPALFAGVATLSIDPPAMGSDRAMGVDVSGVLSSEGECILFPRPVHVASDGSTPLHSWLGAVSEGTACSLARGAGRVAASLSPALQEGLDCTPTLLSLLVTGGGSTESCEAVLLGLAVGWTAALEGEMLGHPSPSPCRTALSSLLGGLSRALASTSVTRPGQTLTLSLSGLSVRKTEQAITDLVHKRDVTAGVGGAGTRHPFHWQVRMRTYMAFPSPSLPPTLSVRMGVAAFTHGLEYSGVGERLVVTPLTDRAYLALTHALHCRLGGSPFGPAGTGKTETVKALGCALGRMVLVFNCDEAFDFRAMGRLLSGLARSGAWGCFDEFNRLEERVLSAISAQIQSIQAALAGCRPAVELLGRSVPLHSDVAVFITMNPGYAGRSTLPDNLKALFRPVAMVAPDVSLIANVTLFTQGFVSADSLSSRVSRLFMSAAASLSNQSHYDFGLRALKTCLIQAGRTRRRGIAHAHTQGSKSEEDVAAAELRAVGQCVIGTTLPRLVPSDLAPFRALFIEAFPGLQDDDGVGSSMLAHAIAAVAEKRGLVWRSAGTGSPSPLPPGMLGTALHSQASDLRACAASIPIHTATVSLLSKTDTGGDAPPLSTLGNTWFTKTLQLAHTLSSRHGVMLLGPSGTGKTTSWRTLLHALSLLDGVRGEARVVDPKALCPHPGTAGRLEVRAKEQLFGRLDPATLEWHDGLFTSMLRSVIADARGESSKRHWLVLDGDTDPEWAENLNSVLDDNKILTLPSGERLALPPNVRVVMEADNTRHATLATLSRLGMVCFPPRTLSTADSMRPFVCALGEGRMPYAPGHAFVGVGAGVGGVEAASSPSQASPLTTALMSIGSALQHALCGEEGIAPRVLGWACGGSIPGLTPAPSLAAPIMAVEEPALAAFLRSLLLADLERIAACVSNGSLSIEGAVGRSRQALLLALAWAAGAAYPAHFRRELALALVACPEAAGTSLPALLRQPSPTTTAPCLLDFRLDIQDGTWTPWDAVVPTLDLPPTCLLDTALVVPTVDTLRHTAVLRSCLATRTSLVLCGPPGSGKTMLLNAVLSDECGKGGAGGDSPLWPAGAHVAWLSCSSGTTPDTLLRALEQYCEYVRTGEGWTLTPRAGTEADIHAGRRPWLVLFADEVNLPRADKYGTSRTCAFLRGCVEAGGFWAPLTLAPLAQGHRGGHGNSAPSGSEPAWVTLRNIQFVSACNPPSDAGRVPLPSRLLRHAPVLYVGYPQTHVLRGIYATLTRALLKLEPSALGMTGMADALASACLEVYSSNAGRFDSVRTAPQCVYSPRDLSRWLRALYEGLAPLCPGGAHAGAALVTPDLLVRMWMHEGMRLFHDRLPSPTDRKWCATNMREAAVRWFGRDNAALTLSRGAWDVASAVSGPVLFTDLLPFTGGAVLPVEMPVLSHWLDARARVFVEEMGGTRLVMFEEAAQHVVRIDRVLRQPLGHLLLAGASGTGKTLLPQFVAWLRGMSVVCVALGPRYGLADFDRDLRAAMMRAGAQCEGLAFLFDEGSSLGSAFLERMNALLASGEVPGLFEGEDRAALLSACRTAWNAEGAIGGKGVDVDSDASVLRRFATNVQRNLHVVFSTNPASDGGGVGGPAARRATSPALFNRCVVDWLGEWSCASRTQVAAALLEDAIGAPSTPSSSLAATREWVGKGYAVPPLLLRCEEGDAQGVRLRQALNFASAARISSSSSSSPCEADVQRYTLTDAIVAALSCCHAEASDAAAAHSRGSGPTPFVCPRDFVDLCGQWSSLYASKKAELEGRYNSVGVGVARIVATEAALAGLRAGLAVKQRELSAKTDAANAKLALLVTDQADAEGKRGASLALRQELSAKTEAVALREREVTAQLSAAEPALLEAKASVGAIGRRELDELRSLVSPPAPVKLCLEAVLVLMGVASAEDVDKGALSWADIRKVIKGADFIASVVGAKTEELSPTARRIVQERYIEGDKRNYTYERVHSASKACGPLYNWTVSQVAYAGILERVTPLRTEAYTLAAAREAVSCKSQAVDATLAVLEESIGRLKGEYGALIRGAEALRMEMSSVALKVERAAACVLSLGRERMRWEGAGEVFNTQAAALPADAVLGAAALVYSGWHDAKARRGLEESWRSSAARLGLCLSPSHTLPPLLALTCTPADRLQWQAAGLPSDEASAANAVALLRYRRFPLIIDPSPDGMAVRFLTRMLEAAATVACGTGRGSGRSSVGRAAAAPFRPSILPRASLADPAYLKAVESAARFGTALLLTDAEVLGGPYDTALYSVLEFGASSARVGGGRRRLVRIGEAEVEPSPAFALYLCARDATVSYPPDTVARLSVVNFAITPASLSDALLARLLEVRAPNVQAQRSALLSSRAVAQSRLAALEEKLLSELSGSGDSSSSLLDDTALLEALEATKGEAGRLERQQEEEEAVLASVSAVSAAYSPVADTAARAFVVLGCLPSLVSPLYRHSLGQFQEAFGAALASPSSPSSPSPTPTDVCTSLLAVLGGVWHATRCGMFERHGQVWGVVLLRLAAQGLAEVSAGQRGGAMPSILAGLAEVWGGRAVASDRKAGARIRAALGLSDERAASLAGAADDFGLPWQRSLSSSLSSPLTQAAWASFCRAQWEKGTPACDMPAGWEMARSETPSVSANPLLAAVVTALRRLAVLSCVRPDLLCAATADACRALLPLPSCWASPPLFRALVAQGGNPVLLCCTPGADAYSAIDGAGRTVGAGMVVHVAMGSPDSVAQAEAAVGRAGGQGGWVVLHNVHMTAEWAAGLVNKLSSSSRPNVGFKLILTAEVPALVQPIGGGCHTPSPLDPAPCPLSPALLTACTRVFIETPYGVRPTFLRALGIVQARSRPGVAVDLTRAGLHTRLAWLHTLVQERGRYVPLGWSKRYEHGDPDLTTSLDTVDALIGSEARRDADLSHLLEPVRVMVCAAVHGSRMESEHDSSGLRALASAVLRTGGSTGLDMDGSVEGLDWEHLLTGQGEEGGRTGIPAIVDWASSSIPSRVSPSLCGLPRDADIELEEGAAVRLVAAVDALCSAAMQGQGQAEARRSLT